MYASIYSVNSNQQHNKGIDKDSLSSSLTRSRQPSSCSCWKSPFFFDGTCDGITTAQNHRTIWVERDLLAIIALTCLLKQVPYRTLHREASRWVLNISGEGDSTASTGQLVPGLCPPRSKEVPPHNGMALPVQQFFLPVAPCPVAALDFNRHISMGRLTDTRTSFPTEVDRTLFYIQHRV